MYLQAHNQSFQQKGETKVVSFWNESCDELHD